MKNVYRLTYSSALIIALISTECMALDWQEKLKHFPEEMMPPDAEPGTQSGGLSLSSLSTLLEGGNSALSANTMENAAGVIEYCAKNNFSSIANANRIQRQLIRKLGLAHPQTHAEKKDYFQGQEGLLNTRNGQQLDMNDLSHSELAVQVKTKACDLVMKQGMGYLSH